MSYKVKLVEKKDHNKQLETRTQVLDSFFSDLLDDTKGFKYQIILKVTLKKQAEKRNLIYFILFQFDKKTVINQKFSLKNAS